jgi:hypothetical protein
MTICQRLLSIESGFLGIIHKDELYEESNNIFIQEIRNLFIDFILMHR